MINTIILIAVIVILWNVLNIKYELQTTNNNLDTMVQTLKEVAQFVDHSNEKETNTIRAINEMCNALNQSFTTTGAFMNHTTYSLQTIAVCMIPFIDEIKQRAVESEEYEKAQECVNIINNLKEIIKPSK